MTERRKNTIEEHLARLRRISDHAGVPYGRLQQLLAASEEYNEAVDRALGGYEALADSFTCFFLETIEISRNLGLTETACISEFYTWFVPRLVIHFETLCAAEIAARRGYPYPAYTILRNTLDGVLLTSAAMQKLEHWLSMDGLDPTAPGPVDFEKARKTKRLVESSAFSKMTGVNSGLPKETIEQLLNWDRQFDAEVHDARLSRTRFMGWMTGRERLVVGPRFVISDHQFPNYMNRSEEISWMVHRLLPLLQTSQVRFPQDWQLKWTDLDDVFRDFVSSLTLNLGKKIGSAVVELVDKKFPFNADSFFPEQALSVSQD